MFRTLQSSLLLLLAVFLAHDSVCEAASVQVLAGDTPVVLRGRIGDDSSFVKRIGLVASISIPELILRSTDLHRSGGTELIGRQQVSAASASKFDLPINTPKDFEIKVTGIKFPGTYEGTLYFLQPGQGMNAVLEIPIKVIAEGVPKLSQRKGSESVKIQLFNCSSWGCELARLLQPNAFPSTYPLQFDNSSLEPFQMTGLVTAFGDTTHSSLERTLVITSPVTVPTDAVYTLPISIQQEVKPAPDHYVGDVQLRLPAQDAPIKIPLEVNVRTGPLLPITVLVVGIFLGRILKYMKDKGGPQSDLLLSVYQLESRVSMFPADQAIVQPMIEEVKARIYDMKLDQAKANLTTIEARLTLLSTLRSLEQTLQPHIGEAGVAQILNDIQAARGLIAARQDQQASDAVARVETEVRNLVAPQPPAARSFALATAQARTATVAAIRAVQAAAPVKLPPFVRLLTLLTGVSGAFRAELTLWVVRPLVYIILIGALLYIGLQQLYIKNPTFGSDPLSDYFGVLVWAMSSDVASRTLSSLKTGS